MSDLAKNKELWNQSIEKFKSLYNREPETPKDFARVTHIYTVGGGEFVQQESLIPFTIKESVHCEGVFDSVKNQLLKIFKNPMVLGIALYFLNNLYKKHKQ